MTYFSDKQLAQRFGIHRTTLWAWVRDNGFPPPIKLSEHCTRWRLSDVEAWEAARAAETGQVAPTPSKARG